MWYWHKIFRHIDQWIGWHHGLNGHEFETILGDSEGQGSPVCCSPWDCRVRHGLVTEQEQHKLMRIQSNDL